MHRWDGEKAPRVVTRRGAGCIRLARDAQGRLTLTLPLGAPPGADRLFLQGWREGRALAPAGASDAFPQRLAAEAARLAGQLGFPAPELRAETE